MKGISIIIVLFISSIKVTGQAISPKELAQNNFEEFFFEFRDMYPADKNIYSFENYSKLDSIFAIPEDLITLSEMDNFDDTKTYFSIIKDLGEDKKLPLSMAKIDILKLEMPIEIKSNYQQFLKLINDGDLESGFDEELARKLANELKNLLAEVNKPFIGYYQTVISKSVNINSKETESKESQILIQYNSDLEVVNFSVIVK